MLLRLCASILLLWLRRTKDLQVRRNVQRIREAGFVFQGSEWNTAEGSSFQNCVFGTTHSRLTTISLLVLSPGIDVRQDFSSEALFFRAF